MSRKNIPNALLIGAQKCGTTSYFDWIAQHPEVYTDQRVKDQPFFWHDAAYNRGDVFFEEFFKTDKEYDIILSGNVNDIYFESVPRRIALLDSDVKLILCVRNPIDRAYSAYLYAVQRGLEKRTFDEAVIDEYNGYEYKSFSDKIQKDYLKHGLYWEQIQRYLECFNQDQIHIVLFDDIKYNPEKCIKSTYAFLGIDSDFSPELSKKNVTKVQKINNGFNELVFNLSAKQPWWWYASKKLMSKRVRTSLRSCLLSFGKRNIERPLSPRNEIIDCMRLYYSKDVNGLSEFMGLDLRNWLD